MHRLTAQCVWLGMMATVACATDGSSDAAVAGTGSSGAMESSGLTGSDDPQGSTDGDDGMVEASEDATAASEGDTGDGESTGSPIECGNGIVEAGEACDGPDPQAVSCQDLGLNGDGLTCTDCQLDVSPCGPPVGMVEVPGGEFEMGSEQAVSSSPVRLVQLDPFWIDQTEVTTAAYTACVQAGVCDEPAPKADWTHCTWGLDDHDNRPINCVDWDQAQTYCAWVGGGTRRLPTEAEWEKAARGTDGRTYPWGDMPEPNCRYIVGGSNCAYWPYDVGSRPLSDSPYGGHDMAGNVEEWVSDWSAAYDPEQTDNPTGPGSGNNRVTRGGAWKFPNASSFRTTTRSGRDPDSISDDRGFRCAMDGD